MRLEDLKTSITKLPHNEAVELHRTIRGHRIDKMQFIGTKKKKKSKASTTKRELSPMEKAIKSLKGDKEKLRELLAILEGEKGKKE